MPDFLICHLQRVEQIEIVSGGCLKFFATLVCRVESFEQANGKFNYIATV